MQAVSDWFDSIMPSRPIIPDIRADYGLLSPLPQAIVFELRFTLSGTASGQE